MKRSHLPAGALICAALFLAAGGRAQETEWDPFDLGSSSLAVPSPNGTNTLNCFLPENGGGYVAIWDDGDGAYVERRNNAGQQLWLWRPPEPRPDAQEVTRAVISSPTHVLWCSAQRWFYLALTNGTVSSSNEWSLPYIDATKLIPQGDLLYVVYGNYASVYDTNMERQATVELNWPAGYWRAYAGAWMVDLSARTTRTLRVAHLGPGLEVQATQELELSHSRAGGYTEHRVLGADANALFVVSSLNWPEHTTYYFTHLTRDGTVTFQHRLQANQIITGAAVLTNGWLLSAQFLGETTPRHALYRVDLNGRPRWQLRIDSSASRQYVAVNTEPPRVLSFLNVTFTNPSNTNITFTKAMPLELRSVRRRPWYEDIAKMIGPPSVERYWDESAPDISSIIGSTNYFWREPVRLSHF